MKGRNTYNSSNALKMKKFIEALIPGAKVVPEIFRTYAGRHQKASGNWLWSMEIDDSFCCVGSAHRVSEILRHRDKICIYRLISYSSGDYELIIE